MLTEKVKLSNNLYSMKNIALLVSTLLASLLCACSSATDVKECANSKDKIDVIVVYYPHWHVYPKGEEWFGKNWTEWEFVKTAKTPRYKGHKIPYIPTTGYLDGKNPKDVEVEIELASNSGIDVFLVDWYWYSGERTMEESLEQGFLKARNRDKMKFALMWANHDRENRFRSKYMGKTQRLMKNVHTADDFKAMLKYCIEHYFKEPNYYKIDGRPVFSIFRPMHILNQIGGAEKVKKLLDECAQIMAEHGLPPVYWSAMAKNSQQGELFKKAGFDNTSWYIHGPWTIKNYMKRVKNGEWIFDYSEMMQPHRDQWKDMLEKSPLPNIPVISRGWDTTSRCRLDEPFPPRKNKIDYPYTPSAINNTADRFETLLRDAKAVVESDPKKPRAILINAWNEYTEGAYLLPDHRDSDASLKAIASVFGRKPADKYTFVDTSTKKLFTVQAPTFENVAYGKHEKQKLDIWLPKNAKAKNPVVIYYHGGAWSSGGMDRIIGAALPKLLEQGIAVAVAKYRFIQDANDADIYPPIIAPMQDSVATANFIIANSQKWNIDTNKIALAGGSAGACSALYVSLSGEVKKPILAVATFLPQTSLNPKQMKEWIPNIKYGAHAFRFKDFDQWLKESDKVKTYIEKYSPASALQRADSKALPKFIIQNKSAPKSGVADSDPTHSPRFGVEFKKLCDAKGAQCELVYSDVTNQDMFDKLIEELTK